MRKEKSVKMIKERLAKMQIAEGATYDKKKIQEVAVLFVNYLIGSSKSASSKLASMKPFINPIPDDDYEKYNNLHVDLYSDMVKVLNKHLKDF